MRNQREIEEDICMMEQSLEHAETHGMYKQSAKIGIKLYELDDELFKASGIKSDRLKSLTPSLGA